MISYLDCAGKAINLSQPQVMGILNITPDSFSDGGLFMNRSDAIQRGLKMVSEGAAIIDVGGESTRPGAIPVSIQQELDRVIPVIEALTAEIEVPISVDTSKPEVMREAVNAGASFINDIRALQQPGALKAAFDCKVPICLMHMQGHPQTMQENPVYTDVITQVKEFLAQRIQACLRAGIAKELLLIDPGFGFGKTISHNLAIIKRLEEFNTIDLPLLLGVSRKSTIGEILKLPINDRLAGCIAMTTLAISKGAMMIRAHEVKETVEAIKIVMAVSQGIS